MCIKIDNVPRTDDAPMDPTVPTILTNAMATARFADDSDIELLIHAILVIGTLEDWAMKNLQLL